MDANEYYLNQHLAQEDAEDARQEMINARANDLQLEMVHSEGDFLEAVGKVVESFELMAELHEKFVQGRRADFGIEFCEKIDEAMSEVAMELAKAEFE